jgi:hypothetical protein
MGNVIPWSQIHPSIKTEEPFVAVVIVDPQREICISELVEFELETLANPDAAAPELIAAAQAAAAKVASGYRTRRKMTPSPETPQTLASHVPRGSRGAAGPPTWGSEVGLRVLRGGKR